MGSDGQVMTKYLRSIRNADWWRVFLSLVIIGMIAGIMGGGIPVYNNMNEMKQGLNYMKGVMEQATGYGTYAFSSLKDKFPTNQIEVSTRQLIGAIENGHKISARSEYLLSHVHPESISKAFDLIGAVTPEDVVEIKTRVKSILKHTDDMLAAVPADKLVSFITTIAGIDSVKLNTLIDNMSKLHEIKIQI